MPQHLRPNNASREESSHVAHGSNGVQAPINAASAAHEAAHAHVRDLERLRREASGTAAPQSSRIAREGNGAPGGSGRTRRIIVAASVFVGCALAALVLFVGGRAVVDALLLPGILPFNLLKAGINSVITFLVYKTVSRYVVHGEGWEHKSPTKTEA